MAKQEEPKDKPSENGIIDVLNRRWVTPSLAIITGLYGALFYIANGKLDREKRELDNWKAKVETEILMKQFNNNLSFQIFTEVKNVVKDSSRHAKDLVILMIGELLKDDTTGFREKLNNIVLSDPQTTPEQKEKVEKTELFNKEQTSLQKVLEVEQAAEPANAGDTHYRIDIFYLEDSAGASLKKAEAAKLSLQQKYKDRAYDIRVRLLPKNINKRIGYGVASDEIRYERSEAALAAEIKSLLFNSQPGILNEISYKTPNYISVFYK